jgi:predicted Rossmann-fold nucleotide-binding protein
MKPRPIVLIGKDFWSGLLEWTREQQVGGGLVSPGDLDWLHLVDEPSEALAIIEAEHEKFIDALSAKHLESELLESDK